ncbi:hypothetical protein QFC21_005851 [Naganishia friedmannii]|uniref:Uncharacterized protein n=1 Tax=Naganishia friedmannii TaxID=89922 RepID=A0ACC2V6T3_9TREE|nr:hypothetical protein QFC21_005851 [Naganishia friedmannii]
MPVQLRTNTNTRVGADGSVGAGGGWTAYIRQLGRKDPAEGVTRNWVKQGRQVQQAAVVEVGRTGLGDEETVFSPHVYPPAQTPYRTTIAIPSTTSSHPSQTPAPPQATSSSTAAAARPQRAGGGNNRRPQSFYLPSDRVAHFQQVAQDVLTESGGRV